MYSFVEADDRVATVITFIEEALKEIEEMDGSINSYNIHLNVRSLTRSAHTAHGQAGCRRGYFLYSVSKPGTPGSNPEPAVTVERVGRASSNHSPWL
jgi:hypothetical protein